MRVGYDTGGEDQRTWRSSALNALPDALGIAHKWQTHEQKELCDETDLTLKNHVHTHSPCILVQVPWLVL